MTARSAPSLLCRSARRLGRGWAPLLVAATIALLPSRALAAFGATASGGGFICDTGGGLVFTVNSGGDLSSIKLNGNELNISTPSGVNSGFGATSVTSAAIGGYRWKITCVNGDSTHYYLFQSGVNVIYMATYAGHDTEWRFIPRLDYNKFLNVPYCSNYNIGGTAIESADTIQAANGDTISKYYGNRQMKDDTYHSVSGTAGTATMWMGNRETSSGGPFFRDIQVSAGSTGSNPYNYMKSGHAQTESWRQGLHGVYALSFGPTPDFTIWDPAAMQGWVSPAGRGQVVLNGLSGMRSGYTYTIGFANAAAQYWATASSTGAATCGGMKPGSYTMTVYKGELAVYTQTGVSVTAGATTSVNTRTINTDPEAQTAIWRMGKWDGKPSEFLNAANVLTMHPSDHRNASWGPRTIPSTNSSSTWPCYLWRDVNNGCKITFSLTSSQIANHTIRIGITAAISGGRPQIQVNSWASADPGSSTQPASRILTIGTYRGNNVLYSYAVPASAFVAGTNTVTINCVSGSSSTWPWTGPGFSFDCIDLL